MGKQCRHEDVPAGSDDEQVGVVVVLTVAKVPLTAAGGYAEYLEGKAKPTALGDYYLKDGERVEAPGRWVAGATAVGGQPDANVTGDVLRMLMAVRRPDTGAALRASGAGGEIVAAIDATFSAPKSVSAIWALASPPLRERIERAHEQAVDRAVGYTVKAVAMIRERVSHDTVVHTKAGEVIATSWRHTTARAVEDRPADPQLHSHVLLHAAVRKDGRVVAIDSRAWLVHRREVGAAYRTELAHELTQLGYRIQRATGRGQRYFEIDGVPEALLDHWSGRHHQVQAAITARVADKHAELQQVIAAGGPEAKQAARELVQLRKTNGLAPAEDRRLVTWTRNAKRGLLTRTDLDHAWSTATDTVGFDRDDAQRLRRETNEAKPAAGADVLGRLTEFDATFADREARTVALEACAGVRIQDALGVLAELRDAGELPRLADQCRTTRRHRRLEQQTVDVARQLAGERAPAIPPWLVAAQADELDDQLTARGGGLSAEQRQAIELACSDRRLVVIEGQAGTGKSTVLAAVARAHQQSGREIIVTSTAALGAQRLARELHDHGVDAAAYSTVALDRAVADGRLELSARSTMIHDEAGLASTLEQHQLLRVVEASGARLVDVGDPRQSHAVGAGGLWPHLETITEHEQARLRLTRNVRALDPEDRRDQQRFRVGYHHDAIQGYHARGRVHVAPHQRQAEDAALEAADRDRRHGQRTVIIAQTSNEQLDELNARAQAIRYQHRELSQHSIKIPRRPYPLHAGDGIQIRQTIVHPDAGRLANGTIADVLAVDGARQRLTLGLSDRREVTLARSQIDAGDLRLAYVQHPFPAQGQTTDTAHLLVGEHATQEGTYVALTRARQHTHIHASHQQLHPDEGQDRLAVLAEHLGRSEPDVASIDTPLAHETSLASQHTREQQASPQSDPSRERSSQGVGVSQPHRNADNDPAGDQSSRPLGWRELLGPEPDPTDPGQAGWRAAVQAIKRYRDQYHIDPHEPTALGPQPPAGEFHQRLHRRETIQTILAVLDQDRADAPSISSELRRDLGVEPQQRSPDRDIGWEP